MAYCDFCDMDLAFCVHGMPVKEPEPPKPTKTRAASTRTPSARTTTPRAPREPRAATATAPRVNTLAQARARFDELVEVEPARQLQVVRMKREFLVQYPSVDVGAIWEKYQEVFSPEGLQTADPKVLKDLANSRVGTDPAIASEWNRAWNELGYEQAADRIRAVISHLLYGEGELSDRLTDLIEDRDREGMPGLKEAMLTRVLSIMRPEEFLPILTYNGPAGKRMTAKVVWDVDLPTKESGGLTVGRLIVWSNNALIDLAGEGFSSPAHLAQFLWMAKERPEDLA